MANLSDLPQIDDSQWPVVVTIMPRHPLSDEQLAAHLVRLREFWRRGQRFGLIVDVRAAPPLPPPQRRMVAEHLDQSAEQYPNLLFGVAVILNNSIQRGIVSVLTWLMRKPFEIQSHATVELGIAWILRGLSAPIKVSKNPGARAFRA